MTVFAQVLHILPGITESIAELEMTSVAALAKEDYHTVSGLGSRDRCQGME